MYKRQVLRKGWWEKSPPAEATAKTTFPQIVNTVPEVGATDVDSELTEISVTFDRDMDAGMSWTGGPPQFPTTDEAKKARWINKRTCVLPVKLAEESFYRVGINSTSYRNFRSAEGVPAPCEVICFSTKGATPEVKAQCAKPEIVSIEPQNGSVDVDPKLDVLKITFNVPMGKGMSWTGGGANFPRSADGRKASWSQDGLTCTLPVSLEPGREYELGLNSVSHINFQTKWGVPLAPVLYKFRTRTPESE